MKEITLTNEDAKYSAAVLAKAINTESTANMDSEGKSKAVYRLGKAHGSIVSKLKSYNEHLERLQEEHIKRDKKGEKVVATTRAKNEETGEWEDRESGFEITDPDLYLADIKAVSAETFKVELPTIPLDWLEGNAALGFLASACAYIIEE